jgi:hypothetical protein
MIRESRQDSANCVVVFAATREVHVVVISVVAVLTAIIWTTQTSPNENATISSVPAFYHLHVPPWTTPGIFRAAAFVSGEKVATM